MKKKPAVSTLRPFKPTVSSEYIAKCILKCWILRNAETHVCMMHDERKFFLS